MLSLAKPPLRNYLRKHFSSHAPSLKQFVVIARDAKDKGAFGRRLEIRPKHLEGAIKANQDGKVILGGAILDEVEKDKMVGSVMIVDMESREEVDKFIREDPYVKNGVWESWEILSFRKANLK